MKWNYYPGPRTHIRNPVCRMCDDVKWVAPQLPRCGMRKLGGAGPNETPQAGIKGKTHLLYETWQGPGQVLVMDLRYIFSRFYIVRWTWLRVLLAMMPRCGIRKHSEEYMRRESFTSVIWIWQDPGQVVAMDCCAFHVFKYMMNLIRDASGNTVVFCRSSITRDVINILMGCY